MNKWVVALSAQASDMSGWLLMGLPGAIYVGGISGAWIDVGLLAGTYLNWKAVARRLRCSSRNGACAQWKNGSEERAAPPAAGRRQSI